MTKHQTITKKTGLLLSLFAVLIFGFMAGSAFAAKQAQSDLAISDAVEDQLLWDSAVPAYRIDVVTVDGVVTLNGYVDNILAKERAARIAAIVKGVRAVINDIKVDPLLIRSDVLIREDVEDALLEDAATDAYQTKVKVTNGVVTLSGTVDSWQEKHLCETVAKGVRGVKGINNEIKVSWPEVRSDTEIAAEIEKALKWDVFVDNALIDVSVQNGTVTLSGVVGSSAEKNMAIANAYVHGVKAVESSQLKVKRWARDKDLKGQKYAARSKVEVENAIKAAFLYDPRVSIFDVTPEVSKDGSSVVLRGTVDNLKAKLAAGQDARNTAGVLLVDNRIKVRPVGLLSDEKIETRIEKALLRDPYLENYKIAVDVKNGVADLKGTVDSYFEKLHAKDVASRVSGVIVVDNNLSVLKTYDIYLYDPYVDSEEKALYEMVWIPERPGFPAKSDAMIKEDINDQLFWSPFVDADQVTVTVEGGVATLTGTVDSWPEYNAAAINAYEGGAVFVNNDLVVAWP